MKWVRIKAFIVAYIKALFRDKASVFWIIVWPLLILLMTAYIFIPPSFGNPVTLNLGVVNNDVESMSPFNGTSFVVMLKEFEYNGTKLFEVKLYGNESMLINELRRGKLDAGIVIPEGFGEEVILGQAYLKVYISGESVYDFQVNKAMLGEFMRQLSVHIALEKLRMTMKYVMKWVPENVTIRTSHGVMSLRELIWRYMLGMVLPINASVKEVAPKAVVDRPYLLGWFSLGAIGMMLLYSGFSIGATTIVEEKEEGRLYRILSTPVTEIEMLIGKTIGGLVVLAISSLIIVVAAIMLLHAKVEWNPLRLVDWLVPLHLLLISIMTISIGLMISLVAKTTKGASNLATVLGLVLAFITGIWFPREWMPKSLRILADIFPITWSVDVMRDIMVKRAMLHEVMIPTVKCVFITIGIFTIGIMLYRKMIRKYVEM